jgi:hypothetical protein
MGIYSEYIGIKLEFNGISWQINGDVMTHLSIQRRQVAAPHWWRANGPANAFE